ncbi:unnamed protein product [Peronospora belbahrii]|uniref:AAA+ ATPase domain-containing protein n=2 Tax=Peronospora belbahrii TaxID=622444 RepID=A0AAU9KPT4_9STRA|nr:unnamed protein product [Peronospora belbahrii]
MDWKCALQRPFPYDPKDKYVSFEKADVWDFGAFRSQLKLYCRPSFHRQIDFMREKVLEEKHVGYVLGPPGTGKSTAAMVFALAVDRTRWDVIWIHVEGKILKCVHMSGQERKTGTIDIAKLTALLESINAQNCLVLVDGWTYTESRGDLEGTCFLWYTSANVPGEKRLVFICSVASRGKSSADFEYDWKILEHEVWSWTLDEYLDAINDKEFFNNVLPKLDATSNNTSSTNAMQQAMKKRRKSQSDDPFDNRAFLLETKYHYAGGSCRCMFLYTTAEVIRQLNRAIEMLPDYSTATLSSGSRSPLIVNRLFALFESHTSTGVIAPLISRYTAIQIGIKTGPDEIKHFFFKYREFANPAFSGWMLEMAFFISLRHGGLEIFDESNNIVDKWEQATVVDSDGVPELKNDGPVWIRPLQWNQGGYDAIMVCKQTRFVRMVQITCASTHTFRIDYFYSWLKKLSETNGSFNVDKLEIVFVVAKDSLQNFTISNATGQGLLEAFGWEKNTEISRVRIVGMRGLISDFKL